MPRNRLVWISLLTLLWMTTAVSAQDATPTLTPEPPTATPIIVTEEYIVQRGESLNMIAQAYGATVRQLLALNPDITNADLVYAGQTINVPAPGAPTATPEATLASEITSTPTIDMSATPVPTVMVSAVLEYGLEVAFSGQADPSLTDQVVGLGMKWVKLEVRWENLQPNEGDPLALAALDEVVSSFEAQGVNILLTVTTAPAWTRTLDEETGPPDDLALFAAFVGEVAQHYAGIVDAYEIWNEPNIRSKWKSPIHPIGAAQYMDMLRQAHAAIKAADPNALIVSAGLAPTGFNDAYNAQAGNLGVNAVDDRVFLRELYSLGLADYADAVGAHPMGWANPPEAVCCNAAEGVLTHFESPQFYFLNTLQDYRAIMEQAGDLSTPIWITKFGWGTSEDLGASDPTNVFVEYTTMDEQADYISRAYQLAAGLGYVGPMFTYNLNGCIVLDMYNPDACYYSLLDPNGVPRPAFASLSSLGRVVVEPAMEVTPELLPESTVEITPEATSAG